MTSKITLLMLAAFLLLPGCSGHCEYNGKEYSSGDKFYDDDLCNQCSCQSNGAVACTLMACSPLIPRDGSSCVPKWGGVWGTTCQVTELESDGTRLGELPRCGADGGVADAGTDACWELVSDPSCAGTGQRIVITPAAEPTGHFVRVSCY